MTLHAVPHAHQSAMHTHDLTIQGRTCCPAMRVKPAVTVTVGLVLDSPITLPLHSGGSSSFFVSEQGPPPA
jgi:hypothetical protein